MGTPCQPPRRTCANCRQVNTGRSPFLCQECAYKHWGCHGLTPAPVPTLPTLASAPVAPPVKKRKKTKPAKSKAKKHHVQEVYPN